MPELLLNHLECRGTQARLLDLPPVGIGIEAIIVDPLEGSLIILPGSRLVALSAFLGKSRHRTFVYWAFGLTVIGVVAVFVVSMFGNVGGNTGRS